MCKVCDEEREDKFNDEVHEMIHKLIPVLGNRNNYVGLCAMIDLIVMNCNCDKEALLDIMADAFDFYNKFGGNNE